MIQALLLSHGAVHHLPERNLHLNYVCVCALSWVRLFVTPWAVACHQIFQTRTLEWVAISYSRGSSQPRDETQDSCVSCIGRQILYP